VTDTNRGMPQRDTSSDDIVLYKSIFINVFDKDIRRVFMYKKAERLANALGLVSPAFRDSVSLKGQIDAIAVALTTAAAAPPLTFRDALSRELLALSSVLSMARSGGLLSPMNVDLIATETRSLLREIALYEEPQLSLREAPTLAALSKRVPPTRQTPGADAPGVLQGTKRLQSREPNKGHIKDRHQAILSLIAQKGSATIKDLSTIIRGVSEKTIQRELQSLIESGEVRKRGERRWTSYSLA